MIRQHAARLLLVLLAVLNTVRAEEDILSPDQAFPFSVRLADANTLEWRYTIAEGYYLYRDKFAFSSDSPGASLGPPRLPAGKIIEDEFFGRVETYRGELVIQVPLTGTGHLHVVSLKSQFQGCADAGICYTPQVRQSTLQLASVQGGENARSGGALSRLRSQSLSPPDTLPDDGPAKSLPPVQEAFKLRVIAKDAHTLQAIFSPAPAYYLLRDRINITIGTGSGVRVTGLALPRGTSRNDPSLGKIPVLAHDAKIEAVLARSEASSRTIDVNVQFQGCGESVGCYPLTTRRLRVTLPDAPHAVTSPTTRSSTTDPTPAHDAAPPATPVADSTDPVKTESRPVQTTSDRWMSTAGYWWGVAGVALLIGLTGWLRRRASRAGHRAIGP